MKPGDCLKLKVMRVPIYAHHGYVPAYRETTKIVEVRSVRGDGVAVVREGKNFFRLENNRLYGRKSKYEVHETSACRRRSKK